ncbi:MAG TPA: CBS domain-containing protein [Nitriliruptorales bacterium]|nr:CBS domain-containing protein [Nitriliruptorales bacterium]
MPTIGELVEQEAVAVARHEPLANAAKHMFEHRVGAVVVLEDSTRLVGIFTERDLLRACAAGVDTQAATVGNWMTHNPVTVTTDTHAAAALQVMIDRDFRHLPVLGEGGVVGVVSMRRLSRALQHERMG